MSQWDYVNYDVAWKWCMNDHVQSYASRQWCDKNYNPRQLPALVSTFEYWPAIEAENGYAFVTGMDHWKPGCWREFMYVEEPPKYNPRAVPSLIGACDVDAGFVVIYSPDRRIAKVVAGWGEVL